MPCNKFTTDLHDPYTRFNNEDRCAICRYKLKDHEEFKKTYQQASEISK